jgi:hypothetical protein
MQETGRIVADIVNPINVVSHLKQEPFIKGTKYDHGKPMYDLIPPDALEEFVNVLTFGAKKYAPDNWRLVPEGRRRYFAAAQRHLWQFKRGETTDPESGLHHLAHAVTCLMFILEKEMLNEVDLKEEIK